MLLEKWGVCSNGGLRLLQKWNLYFCGGLRLIQKWGLCSNGRLRLLHMFGVFSSGGLRQHFYFTIDLFICQGAHTCSIRIFFLEGDIICVAEKQIFVFS